MHTNTSNQTTPQLATIKRFAMGCHIQISLDITKLSTQYSSIRINQQVAFLTNDIQQRLAYWTHIFSRFDETSELMRLNSHNNQWFEVSSELFEVLQCAIHFVSKTQGLVTPTLLHPLWAAGYKYSFETLPKMSVPSLPVTGISTPTNVQDTPSADHANQHIERIKIRQLADGQHQVYLPAGMALDLNGYVKGWCAMQLAEYISQTHDWHMPCLVDMGGDIAIGVPKNKSIAVAITPITWGVAIAKPYILDNEQVQDNEDVAILKLSSGAVATSGQDYRRWLHDGRWQHHLIHPHDLRPVTSDVLTATIVAKDAMTAEVYAKYCVLLGIKAAMAWLNKHHIAALLIDTENNVRVTPTMWPKLLHTDLIAG